MHAYGYIDQRGTDNVTQNILGSYFDIEAVCSRNIGSLVVQN